MKPPSSLLFFFLVPSSPLLTPAWCHSATRTSKKQPIVNSIQTCGSLHKTVKSLHSHMWLDWVNHEALSAVTWKLAVSSMLTSPCSLQLNNVVQEQWKVTTNCKIPECDGSLRWVVFKLKYSSPFKMLFILIGILVSLIETDVNNLFLILQSVQSVKEANCLAFHFSQKWPTFLR